MVQYTHTYVQYMYRAIDDSRVTDYTRTIELFSRFRGGRWIVDHASSNLTPANQSAGIIQTYTHLIERALTTPTHTLPFVLTL